MKNLTLKYFTIILFVFLTGCMSTGPLYYGIGAMGEPTIEYINGWYEVSYYIQVGKDADYYTVHYYVKGEHLNSNTRHIKELGATYYIKSLESFAINQPDTVTAVITSYIGKDMYRHSNTETFTIVVE